MMEIRELILKFIEIFKKLILLLDSEREALKKDNAEEIASLLQTKREIAAKISELERKRQEIIKDKKIEDLVVAGLISKEEAYNFVELTEKVKEKNETNMLLTKQSLGYIQLMTNLLSPNKNITYKPSGAIDTNTSSNIFNATV